MLKKCPFGDSINDLGILLQPVKSCTYDVSTILRLAKKFPQLKLDTSECLKHLKEEFSDFLSQSEIQHLITTCSAWDPSFNPLELQGKYRSYWHRIAQVRSLDGELRFPLLSNTVTP